MNRHGLSNHPLYRVWNGMKQRCKNPHDDFFYCYGARGIKVCSDWSENFKNFYKWAVENGYHKGLTIDRKDTDGDYCPDNCRWVTMREQQSNKRSNVTAPTAGQRWMEGTKVNENFEKIKGRLGEAEVLAQLAEECTELAQAALKLRRALDGKNPTQNTEEERRRALLEEYTDVIHCALVLDLEMDLDQIRKKTERWMRRLGIGEEDGN